MKEAGSTCTVGLLRIDFGRSDAGMQVDARMDFANQMMLGRVIFASRQQSIKNLRMSGLSPFVARQVQ